MIDKIIIVLFSNGIINELYILLAEKKETKFILIGTASQACGQKNMDRETRDLEKHLQRTPKKKDYEVSFDIINSALLYNFVSLL